MDFHWGPALGLAPSLQTSAVWSDSFGSLAGVTATFATQIGTALAQRNLAWAPGGFPGGTTDAARRSPAVLLTPRSQLRELDLKPYEAAIAAGAEMVHVGTTLVPTIDSERPACLSPIVIRDVLRDALDFDGIVIAGPIDAPEVSRISDTSTAAVEALVSGADMIYWEGSGPRVARAIVDIVRGVERGIIPESMINDAFTRIVAYKERRGLATWPAPDKGAARDVAKNAAKRREAAEIERRAITLLRNREEVLPLVEGKSELIGVTGAYGVQELQEALEEYFKTVAAQSIGTARHATRIQDFEIARLTRPGGPVKTAVVVFSSDIELTSQIKLISGLKQIGQRVVVVLLGQPRNVQAYDDADALILAYGDVSNPAETMTAVADMLAGYAPIEVLPPLRELELRAGEPATFDVHDVVRTPTGRLPVTLGDPFVAGYAVSYRSPAVADSVRWDFGDGKQSRDPVTAHAYKDTGTYQITLRVGKKFSGEGTFRVVVK
jgi:beta-N-acetylhexosaminidase